MLSQNLEPTKLSRLLSPQASAEMKADRLKARAAKQAASSASLPKAPDLVAWIESEVTIEDPQATMGIGAIIPFALWPTQRDALASIASENQMIILKARQLGLSWLVVSYALWLCLFHPGRSVLVFSRDLDSATEMVRRAVGVYKRLRRKPPARATIDNTKMIAWDNGSRIKSFAATEDAGSSFTASLTILDEFAKMHYAESLYTSVKPTIDDGGRIVIISTAKGEDNPFHRLWNGAVSGANHLKPIFLPWSARPDRNAAWYARVETDAISPAHHKQEYPASPDEAFTTLGEEAFLPSAMWWDACRESLLPLGRETIMLAADAATVSDSFGLVGVTSHPTRAGDYAVRYAREWKPAGGMIDFYADDGPYAEVVRLCREYNVAQLVYDPTEMRQFALRLSNEGVVYCHEFSQQAQRLESDKNLYDMILARRLAHDGNEALRAHVLNANRKPEHDEKSDLHRLRIVKRAADKKIDLAVALSMALYSAQAVGL